MAEGLNRITLIGNLGQDPELRFTSSQQPVLNLSLATTESFVSGANKERQERTEWHSVVIWGARGKALSNILSKGSRICVEGRIQSRTHEKDGEKRKYWDVVATNVILLGSKRNDGRNSADDQSGSYEADGNVDTSDIPF